MSVGIVKNSNNTRLFEDRYSYVTAAAAQRQQQHSKAVARAAAAVVAVVAVVANAAEVVAAQLALFCTAVVRSPKRR